MTMIVPLSAVTSDALRGHRVATGEIGTGSDDVVAGDRGDEVGVVEDGRQHIRRDRRKRRVGGGEHRQ